MSYSTRAEVREMITESAVDMIVGKGRCEDEQEQERLLGTLIDVAIADADGEIDGYVGKRYNVPLSPVPKVVNKFAKDIALYNLFSRSGIEKDGRDSNFLTRYNSAIKFLTMIAEGRVSIGVDTDTPASAAATGFSVSSNPRLFSRNTLKGM